MTGEYLKVSLRTIDTLRLLWGQMVHNSYEVVQQRPRNDAIFSKPATDSLLENGDGHKWQADFRSIGIRR